MKKNKLLLKTAITAALSLGVVGSASAAFTAEEIANNVKLFTKNGLERCAGVVKAGLNDCPTSQHACAGLSDEDSDYEEYIWLPVGTCDKIVGAHKRSVKSKSDIEGAPEVPQPEVTEGIPVSATTPTKVATK